MSHRFARNGWPRGSESIDAAQLNAPAGTHTKGAWLDLDASVARDICGFYLWTSSGAGSSGVDTSTLMDIGVGATGDAVDEIKVNNIPFGAWGGLAGPTFIPLYVRAGERLAGRIQSAVTNWFITPRLVLCYADRMPGWGGYSASDTYTANTATSGPTTADLADNAWDEAVASTTNPIRALTFHPCIVPGTTVLSSVTMKVDIGYGAGGSELALGTWTVVTTSLEVVAFVIGPPFIECEIAAGSRLAIRKNDTNNLSGLVIGWR